MMRPCALKTPKGITSIGVVSSNCCPNRSAALVFAAWAALAFASCRSNSAVAFWSSETWAGWGWMALDAAHPMARSS